MPSLTQRKCKLKRKRVFLDFFLPFFLRCHNFSINWKWQFNSIRCARATAARKRLFINISLKRQSFSMLGSSEFQKTATTKSNIDFFSLGAQLIKFRCEWMSSKKSKQNSLIAYKHTERPSLTLIKRHLRNGLKFFSDCVQVYLMSREVLASKWRSSLENNPRVFINKLWSKRGDKHA